MLTGSPILDFDGNRWVIKKNALHPINVFNDIAGPKWVVTDFGGATFDVETISGPPSHAAPLIERRLRDSGDLDSAGRIIVHHTHRAGGTTTVFYTAVEAKTFAHYHDHALEQSDHCLLIPIGALMLRYLQKTHGGPRAAVLRQGRHLYLLIADKKTVIGVANAIGFSAEVDDMKQAVENLAGSLLRIQDEEKLQLKSIQWLNWYRDEVGQADLPNYLQEVCSVPVDVEKDKELSDGSQVYRSSLHKLLATARDSDSANDPGSRTLFKLEKYLPLAAVLLISVCLGVFGVAWRWQEIATGHEKMLASESITEVQSALEELSSRLPPATPAFVSSEQARQFFSFTDKLYMARQAQDIFKIINDIGEARPPALRISALSFTAGEHGDTVVITGDSDSSVIDAPIGLDHLNKNLVQRGYRPAGEKVTGNKDMLNGFQLTYSLEGSDGKI